MGFIDKISKVIDVLTEDESIEKGDEFEKCVVHLFDTQNYFSIVEWTSDISRKHDCFVESDCNPDLVMRYKHKSKILPFDL